MLAPCVCLCCSDNLSACLSQDDFDVSRQQQQTGRDDDDDDDDDDDGSDDQPQMTPDRHHHYDMSSGRRDAAIQVDDMTRQSSSTQACIMCLQCQTCLDTDYLNNKHEINLGELGSE